MTQRSTIRRFRLTGGFRLAVLGCALLSLSGCVGPNPGFFVATSAANAAISTLVGSFLTNTLGLGG